jgi:hypothetical protein
VYLQADKPFSSSFVYITGGALRPSRGARGGAGRPHKKEKKEVTEASGSPQSTFFHLYL